MFFKKQKPPQAEPLGVLGLLMTLDSLGVQDVIRDGNTVVTFWPVPEKVPARSHWVHDEIKRLKELLLPMLRKKPRNFSYSVFQPE